MTSEQRALARHALGLPNINRETYRNRFLAAVGHQAAWREMVQAGLAVKGAGSFNGDWFILTMAGAREALEPNERLCREDFPA